MGSRVNCRRGGDTGGTEIAGSMTGSNIARTTSTRSIWGFDTAGTDGTRSCKSRHWQYSQIFRPSVLQYSQYSQYGKHYVLRILGSMEHAGFFLIGLRKMTYVVLPSTLGIFNRVYSICKDSNQCNPDAMDEPQTPNTPFLDMEVGQVIHHQYASINTRCRTWLDQL